MLSAYNICRSTCMLFRRRTYIFTLRIKMNKLSTMITDQLPTSVASYLSWLEHPTGIARSRTDKMTNAWRGDGKVGID